MFDLTMYGYCLLRYTGTDERKVKEQARLLRYLRANR